jgi:hypothetical protein
VKIDKAADGVWYVTGGSHHSMVVEMKDHLVVIEGPQNDARATAVIADLARHKFPQYFSNNPLTPAQYGLDDPPPLVAGPVGLPSKMPLQSWPQANVVYNAQGRASPTVHERKRTMPTITLEVQDRGKAITLLEAALQRQVAHVEMGVIKTRQCLEAFERKYGCTLATVDTTGVDVDPLDRAEWEGEAEMLRRLELERPC